MLGPVANGGRAMRARVGSTRVVEATREKERRCGCCWVGERERERR